MIRPPRRSTLFPYTTLFRSRTRALEASGRMRSEALTPEERRASLLGMLLGSNEPIKFRALASRSQVSVGDRKSTRLNSSHANISYAVFCLKKKKYHLSHALL